MDGVGTIKTTNDAGGSRGGGQRGHGPPKAPRLSFGPHPQNAKRKARQAPDKLEIEEKQRDFDTSMT